MIQGSLCELRPMTGADQEKVFTWRTSSAVEPFFPNSGPDSLQKQLNWFATISSSETDEYFVISSIDKKDVGLIFLNDIDEVHKNSEFGFYIAEEKYRSTGIAIEAELLILEYCFEEKKLHKVYCESLSSNKAVCKIHEKFGFIEEGVKRECVLKNSKYMDLIYMGILESEFAEKKQEIRNMIQRLAR